MLPFVPGASMARESTVVAQTLAGMEIGVASTKAFTCQLTVLPLPRDRRGQGAGRALRRRGKRTLVDALIAVPGLMSEALKREGQIEALSRELSKAKDVLYSAAARPTAGHGRGAEAQGNLLHPCGGLCRGRTEARADRAHRRGCR